MFPGAHAATTPDAIAIVMNESGERLTYAELDAMANRISRVLYDAGLRPGDHVAFCVENRLEFLPLAWGAHYAGLYYTAISTRLTAEETAYIVNDSGSRALVVSPYVGEVAVSILADTPGIELRLSLGGPIAGHASLEDAMAALSAEPLEARVEGQDMLYSSGTTGRPKGVKAPLPGLPLGSPPPLFMLVAGLFGANAETVYLSPAPLYHAAPLRFCMQIHRAGGQVVVMERFDAVGALGAIEAHHVTFVQMVPTMFVRLLKLDEADRSRFDLSSLRCVVHAAAPCPIPVKEQMIEWWGPVIHEYYAGTEGNGFCYCNSEQWLAHKGTVGTAVTGILHIVGDDGEEVAAGEPGTIYFESPVEFAYHNDPEKTKSSYNERGWSSLGDVGYLDGDGFLFLTDRKAYMIITGGVNVYPQEAENLLTMHPAVYDVAVFGIPDDDFGEQVKAVVQPAEGVTAGPELEAELLAYCREHLADVKCPRSVDFRGELPRHPTGKLYKRLLKDEYWRVAGRSI